MRVPVRKTARARVLVIEIMVKTVEGCGPMHAKHAPARISAGGRGRATGAIWRCGYLGRCRVPTTPTNKFQSHVFDTV